MQQRSLQSLFLYRYRFIIGSFFALIAFMALLYAAWLFIPGGLTEGEQTSVVKSHTMLSQLLSFGDLVNAPYHLLQQASLHFFGVRLAAIKLPSILIGATLALLIFMLLRQWFKDATALLIAVITLTTGQFAVLAQNGTPYIMSIFWPALILALATSLMRAKHQLTRGALGLVLAACVGLSLYTPLMIYFYGAVALSLFSHPAQRLRVKRASRVSLIGTVLLIAVAALPLGVSIIKQPGLLGQLLGIHLPLRSPIEVWNNLIETYRLSLSPTGGHLIIPIISIGVMALALLGFVQIMRHSYAIRSHLFLAWFALAMIPLLLSEEGTALFFIPLIMFSAAGLSWLFERWYTLFPRNPYPRVFGLGLILCLTAITVLIGLQRFNYGYRYDPVLTHGYSQDIPILHSHLSRDSAAKAVLLVTDEHADFYRVLADRGQTHYGKQLLVATSIDDAEAQAGTDGTVIIERQATFTGHSPSGELKRILVNDRQKEADRFYLYRQQ